MTGERGTSIDSWLGRQLMVFGTLFLFLLLLVKLVWMTVLQDLYGTIAPGSGSVSR